MESQSFKISPTTTIHAQIASLVPNRNKKPLLVFFHYWGGTSATWRKLTEPTSPTSVSTDYPTLALDLRGWGKSTGPSQDDGNAYSATSMASDAVQILTDISQNDAGGLLTHGLVLVGHSMGAKVALATLANLPETLLKLAKGLVLIAPSPPSALHLPAEMKEQQRGAYSSEESVRFTLGNILSSFTLLDEDDIRCGVRDSLSGNELAKKAWPAYGMEEDISSEVKTVLKAVVASDPGFKAVVLIGDGDIVETKEKVEAEVVQVLVDSGVQTSVKVVQNVRHLLPLEAPRAVQEVISKF